MERAAEAHTTLTVLIVSARPPILSFFETMAWRVDQSVTIEHAHPTRDEIDARIEEAAPASVVVVDVALDAATAVDLCKRLVDRRPEVPVLALVCCPFCITPATTAALLAAGVSGLFDLRSTARETLRMLRGAAGGDTVLHLRLGDGRGALLRDALSGREPRTELQRQLLELVASGLPDHEIGKRLHVSPHTVKHRVEELRRVIGARNRIELAAWAGRNGFYAHDARAS